MLTPFDNESDGDEWKPRQEGPEPDTIRRLAVTDTPNEVLGMQLLLGLPATEQTDRSIRLLAEHRDRIRFWPKLCHSCRQEFRPTNRQQVRCAECRTLRQS